MPKKRSVINVNTLQIYPSLGACARSEKVAPACIFKRIEQASHPNHWESYKTHNKKFAYYDEWLYSTDKQKRRECIYKNVDFMVI